MSEPKYHSFEEYWEASGARTYKETAEERARHAWEAAKKCYWVFNWSHPLTNKTSDEQEYLKRERALRTYDGHRE